MRWFLPLVLISACSADDPADSPAHDVVIGITLDETWRGSFATTQLEYKNIDTAEKGPTVTADGATVTVTWRHAVFEDCQTPTGFRVERADGSLTLTLESTTTSAACADNDVIATATGTFDLTPPGAYDVTVQTTVKAKNVGAQNLPPQTLGVTVD